MAMFICIVSRQQRAIMQLYCLSCDSVPVAYITCKLSVEGLDI